ncbi:uncharacterized protein LOC6558235 isoform X2 [Drosophila grimshawi]|uniref:uncharacterized protein LOC6558235 isoform X2 n=1 Tax=Drosophila grimshawi TaxID=7222 RepID=UPI001C931A25|nr:uncharacterized protein LOC6558235 isoform X2 [Drosophila grimshawi]
MSTQSLLNAAKNLCRDDNFVDCIINVGTATFECHKVILANASEFFKRMFLTELGNSAAKEFTLDDTSPIIFKTFREYIYTYDLNMLNSCDSETIMDLFVCGNRWLVPSLREDCLSILTERANTMKIEDLIALFELGHIFDNESLIKHVTLILLRTQVKHLFCSRVLRLSTDVFAHYMAITKKYKREILRYKMIEKYLQFNGFLDKITTMENNAVEAGNENPKYGEIEINNNRIERTKLDGHNVDDEVENNCTKSACDLQEKECQKLREKFCNDIFGQINFSIMSGEEFYDGPGKSKFLTLEDKYEILYKIQCGRIRRMNHLLNQYRASFCFAHVLLP